MPQSFLSTALPIVSSYLVRHLDEQPLNRQRQSTPRRLRPPVGRNPNSDDLHPIRQTFVEEQAPQCGYCIAGPIMYGYAFIRDNPNATRADIEPGLAGILCRCCAHSRMINAIQLYQQENF